MILSCILEIKYHSYLKCLSIFKSCKKSPTDEGKRNPGLFGASRGGTFISFPVPIFICRRSGLCRWITSHTNPERREKKIFPLAEMNVPSAGGFLVSVFRELPGCPTDKPFVAHSFL
jgi:hypothetical protein